MLKCLIDDSFADEGSAKWSENAVIGYFAQNHSEEFKSNISLVDWMTKWSHQEDDTETIRGTLGRLLFSQDDINKPLSVLSGGEQRRMLFGKIILQRANVIILDEPTNHLDMESIESLNQALGIFEGTAIFVSHDREFISSLANKIIEIFLAIFFCISPATSWPTLIIFIFVSKFNCFSGISWAHNAFETKFSSPVFF